MNIENYLKYVSGLSRNLADVDIEVGSRVAISNGDMSIAVCRKKTNGNEVPSIFDVYSFPSLDVVAESH